MTRYAIAIDFDGVIHRYSQGWHDGTCYDQPIEGAFAAIRTLMQHFNVFVLSTRDPQQIQTWLAEWRLGIGTQIIRNDDPMTFWSNPGLVGITQRKLPAVAYIDDRAMLFKPSMPLEPEATEWSRIVEELLRHND